MNRKKFIKTSLAFAGLGLTSTTLFRTKKLPVISGYVSNTALTTIKPNWPGTPIDQNGKFINQYNPFISDFGKVLKWQTTANPQKKEKKEDNWKIGVVKDDTFLTSPNDVIVWLGHASFFIKINEITILIDPVLEGIPLQKRKAELPVDPSKLVNIDYILVSHAHYDHCDKDSLRLLAKQNPKAQFLTGLNMGKIINGWINKPAQCAGWYQQYELSHALKILFLPSRHWSNRYSWDVNESLWGGFMIIANGKTIYYGGDSGYDKHFKEIGEFFPNIDVALIGIGAYAPRWFMSDNHQDPEHGVRAFKDTGAKVMIPFHYGLFDLSDEPMSEPELILASQVKAGQIADSQLKKLKLGERFLI